MKFPPELEKQVLDQLLADQTKCIVFPKSAYRADGSVMVYRNNTSVLLHRYLWILLIDATLGRTDYLGRTCSTEGCANPWHRNKSKFTGRRVALTKCRNGHPYTKENTLTEGRDRCRKCRDDRIARRRKTRRRRTQCKHGHIFANTGVYTWTDSKNRIHHKCKQCTIDRTRAVRAVAKEASHAD